MILVGIQTSPSATAEQLDLVARGVGQAAGAAAACAGDGGLSLFVVEAAGVELVVVVTKTGKE